ncbi:MAG TPA: CopG family transcriptional regulator [Chloroflexota bacterium]|nr:CopG family transcriptional regulator [Chloroflexota bacterium]
MSDEQVSITFRTEASKRDTLDEIAQNLQRDRSYIVNEAIAEYLWRYEHEKRILAESHAAGERGELIDHDDLFDELEREFAGKVDRAS